MKNLLIFISNFYKNLLKIIIILKLLIIFISIIYGMNNSIIFAHIIPIECNEDNTFYPGDSFLINYTISLPSRGIFYDFYGNPCEYYYSLDYVEVFGEDIIGNKSISINDIIKCSISLNASSGIKIINIIAYGKYHYQYWINESNYWLENSITWSIQLKIKVVEYNPCFTTFIYLLPSETTYKSKIVLLIRYDGNSYNLMQRALIDSYDSKTIGMSLLLNKDLLNKENLINLKSLKNFIFEEFKWLNNIDIYIEEKIINGPIIEEFSPKIFNRENRYVKYIFNPIDLNEEIFEKFNISINLYWSRFSNFKISKSLELYNMALFIPIEVIDAKKVYVYTLLNKDFLISNFQEPPEDEWFYEQWINDVKFTKPLLANTLLIEGEGRILIPRTLSCRYNITVEFDNRKGWIPLDLSLAFLTIPSKTIIINTKFELNTTFLDYDSNIRIKINTTTPIKNITIFSKDMIWHILNYEPMNRTYYDIWIEKPRNLKESTIVYMKVVDIWENSKIIELGKIEPYIEILYNIPYDKIVIIILIIFTIIFIYEFLRKILSSF
ncbi:MAG: hypothetical protein QXI57_05415 [Candidatus Methanomethylicaceae archaeon]